MTSHALALDRLLVELDPPPPFPAWTNRWVQQAEWLRAEIRTLLALPQLPTQCRLWPGRVDTYGRGYLLGRRWSTRYLRRGVYVLTCTHHKVSYVAWEFSHGAIPNRHLPFQTCGNGLCFNPAHLALKASAKPTHKDRHYAE